MGGGGPGPAAEQRRRALTVQSADADAAAALDSELANLFAAVGRLPGVKEVPDFDEAIEQLRPRAEGDQLKLELTEENGGIAALTKVLGPTVRRSWRPWPAGDAAVPFAPVADRRPSVGDSRRGARRTDVRAKRRGISPRN